MSYDLMYKAVDKTAWDAFAATFPNAADILVDEIGPIAAARIEDGSSHHVNIRVQRPFIQSDDKNPVNINVCAKLSLGASGVTWINPSNVASPSRIWAGGMNY